MTLREYLESYDREYLNEGIGDKIKTGFKNFLKVSALFITLVIGTLSSFNLTNASKVLDVSNAQRNTLNTYVKEIKENINQLKTDYAGLREASDYFSQYLGNSMWDWKNIKPSDDIEDKMFRLIKTANDRIKNSEKVLKKYQYKNHVDWFSNIKEISDEIKDAKNCLQTVRKSIDEIAKEHKNNREVVNKHNNW